MLALDDPIASSWAVDTRHEELAMAAWLAQRRSSSASQLAQLLRRVLGRSSRHRLVVL